jgi:hypothetical protein
VRRPPRQRFQHEQVEAAAQEIDFGVSHVIPPYPL